MVGNGSRRVQRLLPGVEWPNKVVLLVALYVFSVVLITILDEPPLEETIDYDFIIELHDDSTVVMDGKTGKGAYRSTNATEALQFALDSMGAGSLLVRTGVYTLTYTLFPHSNQIIVGEKGTTLRISDDCEYRAFVLNRVEGVQLRSLHLDGNGLNKQSTVNVGQIDVWDSEDIIIDGVIFTDFRGTAVSFGMFELETRRQSNIVQNCSFYNIGLPKTGPNFTAGAAVYMQGDNIHCLGNLVVNSSDNAFGIDGGSNITLSHNLAVGCKHLALVSSLGGKPSRDIVIDGNVVRDDFHVPIKIEAGDHYNINISGNFISNSSGDFAIEVQGGSHIFVMENVISYTNGKGAAIWMHANHSIIANNRILMNNGNGIALSGCNYNIVSDNVLIDNGMSSNFTNGIWLQYSFNNTITRNEVYNDATEGHRYGIEEAGSDYNMIINNRVAGNRIAGISHGKNSIVQDNEY